MASWRKPFSSRVNAVTTAEIDPGEFSDGSLKYVGERGGNDAPLTYQEATGAPVENDSPLGYSVGPVTIVLLNVTYMIGTGIYSTRKYWQVSASWWNISNAFKRPLSYLVLGLSALA